jgi:hypothetical protein
VAWNKRGGGGMMGIVDIVALFLGYMILLVSMFFILMFIWIKIEDTLDKIKYKIWLRKREKREESEE